MDLTRHCVCPGDGKNQEYWILTWSLMPQSVISNQKDQSKAD